MYGYRFNRLPITTRRNNGSFKKKISEIKISESNGTGEMNEEINLSIKEEELLDLPFCDIRKGQYH